MTLSNQAKTSCRVLLGMSLAIAAMGAIAQDNSSAPPPPSTGDSAPAPRANYGRRGGCWMQAGVSPSVAQQGRQIMQNTRSQVMSVCNDSSLSGAQKQDQVKQLHEQERTQIRGLVTEQQADALQSCMDQRHHGRMGGNPCGQMQRGPGGQEGAPPPDANGAPPTNQAPPPQQ